MDRDLEEEAFGPFSGTAAALRAERKWSRSRIQNISIEWHEAIGGGSLRATAGTNVEYAKLAENRPKKKSRTL